MGYGSVLLGLLVREKMIKNRIQTRRTDLQETNDLTQADLDHLEPYITFTSRWKSRRELIVLTVVYLPFALILVALLAAFGFGSIGMFFYSVGAASSQFTVITILFFLLTPLPLCLLAVICYVLYRRWRRYRLATKIDKYLSEDPSRLASVSNPLPKTRDEIATIADHESITDKNR